MHEGIHIALKAEVLGHVFGVPVTNTMLMSIIVSLALIALGWYIGRNLTKIPSKLQTFVETVFGGLLDYTESVLESRPLALRFFPFLATLFFFILLGNWMGLIPGIGSLTVTPHVTGDTALEHGEGVPLLYPIAVDLNITLALALITFMVIEISGIRFIGFFRYMGKFFNFSSPVALFVGMIELISEFMRIISFSFRLFGNMFAGKTLIAVAIFFVPFIVPVPLMLYEVVVGLIQASIFTLLTLFFIKLAVSDAH